jgi:hypothetical protein
LTADIVTLSLEGAALMPGVHQGWIEVTAWRAANVLRIPLTVNVRPGLSQPETFAIRQVLRPVPIPPLPLVSMPMEGRVQLAKVPPMPVFPKLEPKLAANRQQVGLRRFAATRPVFRGRGRSVSSYKVPEAKPEPVKPADPKAGHGAAPEKKPEPAKAAEAAHGKPADPKAGHGAPEKKPEPAKPAEAAHGKPADPKAGHGAPEKKPEPAKPQQAKAGAEHKPEPPKGAAGSHGKPPDPKTTSKGEPAKASPPQKAEAKPGKGTPAADHAKAAHPPVPVPKPSPVGPPVKPASQVKEHH